MHPKNLRSYAFKNLTKIIFWNIAVVLLYAVLYYYSGDKEVNHNQASSTLESLKSESNQVKTKVSNVKTALIKWNETIKKEHSNRSGLKIKQAQAVIEQLKELYKLNKFSLKFSAPEKRLDIDSKFVDVQYTIISIGFATHTDVNAMLFLSNLLKQMPGHVRLQTLEMKAKEKIDDATLLNISGGRDVDLVNVNINLLWQDMLDKNKPDANKIKSLGSK
jgi:hypothetical protein